MRKEIILMRMVRRMHQRMRTLLIITLMRKILGDVNSDGKVTADDAEILSEYIKGNITCSDLDLSVADVNMDRRIDQRDCINIRRYVNGKRCSPGIGRKLSDLASATIVAGHYIPNDGRLYKPVIYLYPT